MSILTSLADILEQILEKALTAPEGCAVAPETGRISWAEKWRSPQYTFQTPFNTYPPTGEGFWKENTRQIARTIHQDEEGTYTLLRSVVQHRIDATLLRASKIFHKIGTEILYRRNIFGFSPTITRKLRSPSYLYLERDKAKFYYQKAFKPSADNNLKSRIDYGFRQMGCSKVQKLPGWIFYDQFLRFLHSIGPNNAAMLSEVRFEGVVMHHENCRNPRPGCRACQNKDLVLDLLVYIPFLEKYCTHLHKLEIYVHGNDLRKDPEHLALLQQRLKPVLEWDLCKIKSLQTLEVVFTPWVERPGGEANDRYYRDARDYDEDSEDDGDEDENDNEIAIDPEDKEHYEDYEDFVEPVARWFKDRALQRRRQKSDLLIKPQKHHCGFCGEDHLWIHCHNLCSVCGNYGHFRCISIA